MEYAFSLGTNLGERLVNLKKARRFLAQRLDATDSEQSAVYETDPVGVKAEYRELKYLNAVIVLQCEHSPAKVLQVIHTIEADLGRIRTADRFAPRPIDIDILYAGEHMSDSESLELPHPRWAERRFVVQPLADVRPDLVLPGCNQTVAQILAGLSDPHSVTRFTASW